jgi:hypothetical protein
MGLTILDQSVQNNFFDELITFSMMRRDPQRWRLDLWFVDRLRMEIPRQKKRRRPWVHMTHNDSAARFDVGDVVAGRCGQALQPDFEMEA